MVLVRNKMFSQSEYKGRETDAYDIECPCRSCYHPHDFGYVSQEKGYIQQMRCLTREQGSCPDIIPTPEHIYSKRGYKCKRCGKVKNKEEAK